MIRRITKQLKIVDSEAFIQALLSETFQIIEKTFKHIQVDCCI